MKVHRLAIMLCVALMAIAVAEATLGLDLVSYVPWLMGVVAVGVVLWQLRGTAVPRKISVNEAGATLFEPVWVSSTEHLERFDRACKRSNWAQRMVAKFPLDPDMPQVAGQALGPSSVPLLLLAAGRLRLTADALYFSADPACLPLAAGQRALNLDKSLEFSIPLTGLTRIQVHHHEPPFFGAFRSEWVQLVGDTAEGHFNVLLAVGGRGVRVGEMRRDTQTLLHAVSAAREHARTT